MLKKSSLIVLVFFLVSCAAGQNIFTAGLKGNIPSVRFNFENKDARPPAYEINIEATGDGTYSAREDGGTDGPTRPFQVSKSTRDRIFALTETLNQFRGDYEFRKHRIAFSGLKTLTYTEGMEQYTTQFNWSENKDITELASLFQGIANTLYAESELRRLRKFDKLGLDEQLKAMEQNAKLGWLKELNLISKVLAEIKSDPQVMGMARARAERLLKLAETNGLP